MQFRLLRHVALCFVLLFGVLFGASRVDAASQLAALRVTTTGSGVLVLQPGEVKEVTVSFQNIGTSTWKNDGVGYISVYTYGPKYRKSSFDPGTWLSPTQVKRIREVSVVPSATATIAFQLHAPTTEGTYTETFALASEGIAWVDGGEFSFVINVKKSAAVNPEPVEGVDDKGLSAALAMQSAKAIKLVAGRSAMVTAGFTNTGTKAWNSFGLRTPSVNMATTTSAIEFAHSSWSGSQLAYNDETTIAPGKTAYVTFSITAPKMNGTHTAQFQFAANDIAIDDAFVELPIEVTGGAAEAVFAERIVDTTHFIDEPIIRVGVITVDEETQNEVVITSTESDFDLRDVNGNLLAELTKGSSVTASFDGSRYVYDRGRGAEFSSYALRFVPKVDYAVMKIANFDRRVTRGSANADNTFRGVLEFRYNDTHERAWIIDELPMEYYLRGLAETSNISHMEFQKSLMTAARTYAFYHWTRATKHAKEFYHVDAYFDQVYKGYGQEERTPRVTQAIQETRGKVVTYAGDIAITPYFSRSDGQTRNWSDVWGGDIPWAIAVAVPCDDGKVLWGHGVGMSASGALCMANNGMLWEEIVKYFYTGVAIEQRWE